MDWQKRLAEARQRTVFEPTPSGAAPYAFPVTAHAAALDAVETCRAAAQPDSPTAVLATALALLLREHINARFYEENLRNRLQTGPDRVTELTDAVNSLRPFIVALLQRQNT